MAESTGLPLHPLVVHAATVLLPLSLLGLSVAVLVPRLRSRLAGLSVLGLVAGAAAAWLAEESGESLADRVGVSQAHARYGQLLPVLAIVSLIIGATWWRLQRGPAIPAAPSWSTRAAGLAVLAMSMVTTGYTVLAGHSGAASVWESTSRTAAAPAAPATPSTGSGQTPAGAPTSGRTGGYTMAQVAGHNSPTDCWSVVEGTVYDLTAWITQHPGGQGTILGMCGSDATAAFRGKHGTAPAPVDALAGFTVGPLSTGGSTHSAAPAAPATTAQPTPMPTTRYSRAQVAQHGATSDCWSTLNGKVYDLTRWVSRHPGGQEAITEMCGTDGGEFLEQHAGDADANKVLAGYQIGVLG